MCLTHGSLFRSNTFNSPLLLSDHLLKTPLCVRCLTFSSSSPPLQSLGFPSCLGTIAAFFLTPTFQFNLSGSVTSWCCWPQLWQEGRMKRERRVSNLAFSCGSCVIEHTHLHKHSHAKPSYSCESVITGPFVYHETWNMILDERNNEVSELDGDDITCDLSTSSQNSSQPFHYSWLIC